MGTSSLQYPSATCAMYTAWWSWWSKHICGMMVHIRPIDNMQYTYVQPLQPLQCRAPSHKLGFNLGQENRYIAIYIYITYQRGTVG